MAECSRSWRKRLAWLAGLWLAGVAALGVVALAIKALMRAAGLSA
ncbi:MAG: DUF2474 domain-containing protein [Polaromonas sp.]